MLPTIPGVATLAQSISLSLSPIFMLAGIGALLNVLAGRLSRVIDRTRRVEETLPPEACAERDRLIGELRLLDRRISVVNASLFLAVSSAVMTCLVVALLFVGTLIKLRLGTAIALTFILAMALLIASLVSFMVEVRISLRAIHVRKELLR